MEYTMYTQAKKFIIVISNPEAHGYTRSIIEKRIEELKADYACVSDEIGLESGTPHTHIFLWFRRPVFWAQIREAFPETYIEVAYKSIEANRDYVFKQGKWANTEKARTTVPGSCAEYGRMPIGRKARGSELNV